MPRWIVKQKWHVEVPDDYDDDDALDYVVEHLHNKWAELAEEEIHREDD